MPDPKQIVAAGYDNIAQRYFEWSGLAPSPQRTRALERLLALLPDNADVLELGCGAGVPVTRVLAERCRVTGVDISAAQIALAREHVPNATFVQADIAALDFVPGSFDAVVAFYAQIHLPREEHAALFRRIAEWLRPGGVFFATLGANDSPAAVEEDWLGAPMFWSHFDAATNRKLIEEAGLTIADAEIIAEDEDGESVAFLWVTARKAAMSE